MTNLNVSKFLLDGQRTQADLFIHYNKHKYIIVSMKGTTGFFYNEKNKLWNCLSYSQLLCDVVDFLLLKTNQEIEIINNKNTKAKENDDLDDDAKDVLNTMNNKKRTLLEKTKNQNSDLKIFPW